MMVEIERGKDGIVRLKDSLTAVQSKNATAHSPDDEVAVKRLIEHQFERFGGFDYVDEKIVKVMVEWIGTQVEKHIRMT